MAQPRSSHNSSSSGSTARSSRDRSKKPSGARANDASVNVLDFGPAPSISDVNGGSFELTAVKDERGARTKAGKKGDESPAKGSTLEAHAQPVPDTVRERFIQIGNNFFFPDGAEAFTDHGSRVTTRSENAVVIQSMVALAQVRSAGRVTVSGTDFFKREAWFAARLAGLDITGYTPTVLEQERLVRAVARRRTAESEGRISTVDALLERTNGKPERTPAEAKQREGRPKEGELIVGRLVDHGSAPYQHKPKQPMSYYVRIETERGDREVWGIDLERAFRQSLSTPGVGDEVGLRAIGRDTVTVRTPKYDTLGREVGREDIDAHRNQWLVERKDFLDRRLGMADLFRNVAVNAVEGVKQFPELEGSYLQLQVARVGVEQRIANGPAREQFLDHLRAHLAKTIEYGLPLEPVHLKARAALAQPEEVQERDHVPRR